MNPAKKNSKLKIISCFIVIGLMFFLFCIPKKSRKTHSIDTPISITGSTTKYQLDFFVERFCNTSEHLAPSILDKHKLDRINFDLDKEGMSNFIKIINSGVILPSPLKAGQDCEFSLYYENKKTETYEVSFSSHIFRNTESPNINIEVNKEKLIALYMSIMKRNGVLK